MDTEFVVLIDIYKGILAIERNAFESILMKWMNVEPISQ